MKARKADCRPDFKPPARRSSIYKHRLVRCDLCSELKDVRIIAAAKPALTPFKQASEAQRSTLSVAAAGAGSAAAHGLKDVFKHETGARRLFLEIDLYALQKIQRDRVHV